LIFDGKTAIEGASEGISLCLNTLIPSLFPFFVLTGIVTSALVGQSIPWLRPLGRFCHMSDGSESLLAVGILGGYPVGAGNIRQAYRKGNLGMEEANRLAVFCNNAGPSFIFGVMGQLFPDISWAALLWLIQIVSAVLIGSMSVGPHEKMPTNESRSVTVSDCLDRGLRNMGAVCGWVILFRILLEFLDKWVLQYFSPVIRVLITGILELSNGCIGLETIPDPYLRFLLASVMLSLGGICILMQTRAVFPELNIPQYLKGRLIHLLCSVALSLLILFIRLRKFQAVSVLILLPVAFAVRKSLAKKEVAIP